LNGAFIADNESTYSGGGLYLNPECYALMQDCVIVNNDANESGGAMYCDVNSLLDVNSSIFANNNAFAGSGGGLYMSETDANIANCTVSENAARRGGGLYWSGKNPQILDTIINGNSATGKHASGGGFYCIGSGATINNCVITENSASLGFGGGGYAAGLGQEPLIKNCLITENSAGYNGGGFYAAFAENSADGCGGALYSTNNSSVAVIDTIIWGNTADVNCAQIGLDPVGGTADVSYSDVQGGYPGTGNIDDDPCFVGDYYLSQPPDQNSTSPCVNTGSALALTLGFNTMTTATNSALDTGQIDMGYHHRPNYFRLDVRVIGRYGSVVPRIGSYPAGTVVTVRALPERGYKVKVWTGTDDDASTSSINYVTMDSSLILPITAR
jgi:hypothetical protein